MGASEVPLALAFGAGLVASVNPCGFAMLPAFVSYYLGAGSPGTAERGRVVDGLVVGLVLTAGFLTIFAAAGILIALGGRQIVKVVPWLTIVVGVTLVVLGGWLLAGRHLSIPIPGMRAEQGSGYWSIFTYGVAYAVGSLSCTLPIFLLVVGSGLAAGSVVGTVGVFLSYGLGMSTILMLLCLGTAGFREVLVRRIRRLFPYLERISGGLLILGGGYIAYYWISLLSGGGKSGPIRFMQEVQRRAQDLVVGVDQRIWTIIGAGLAIGAIILLSFRLTGQETAPDEETRELPEEMESMTR